MKAPDESSIMKDFPENATEWIATAAKRCTDVLLRHPCAENSLTRRPWAFGRLPLPLRGHGTCLWEHGG